MCTMNYDTLVKHPRKIFDTLYFLFQGGIFIRKEQLHPSEHQAPVPRSRL